MLLGDVLGERVRLTPDRLALVYVPVSYGDAMFLRPSPQALAPRGAA